MIDINQLIHDLRCCGYLVPMCEEECSRSIDDKSRWRNCSDSLKTDAADALEQLQDELANLKEQARWRDAKKELPPAETDVLIVCNRNGYKFVCPAIYEDGTIYREDSCWNWYDFDSSFVYDEEKDDYIIPEGWWENRHFIPDDSYNGPVDCEVLSWRPLSEMQEEVMK